MNQKKARKNPLLFIVTYGFHIFIVFFLINILVAYAFRYYIFGSSCMTRIQVQNDSRCLYIWGNQVYEKGDRANPHYSHPCGTDITSVIPPSHVGNQARYLLPNYVANVCIATIPTPTPKPTLTPTPKPTLTPTPTVKLTATPIPTKVPATSTPIPTHASLTTSVPFTSVPVSNTPIPTQSPTSTLAPTQSLVETVTVAPTITQIAFITATVTPTPSITPQAEISLPVSIDPSIPGINLAVSLSGISGGGTIPTHTSREATVFVYKATDDITNTTIQPVQTMTQTIVFDANTTSQTHSLFINPLFGINTILAGQYQLVIDIPGYVKKQITTSNTKLFSLAPGTITALPQITLLGGDIDGNNTVDIADYNGLLRCYGTNANTPTCGNPQAADLNDDGKIDALDYNILLYNMYAYRQQNTIVTPTATPSPTIIITVIPTVSPVQKITPTKVALVTPPPIVSQKPLQKKSSSVIKTLIAGITNKALLTQVLDGIIFLLFLATVIIGIVRSKLVTNLLAKVTGEAKQTPSSPISPAVIPQQPTIDAVYYAKPAQVPADNAGEWLLLVNGDTRIRGFLAGKTIPEGFVRIKGILKEENGEKYIAISEVLPPG